MTTITISTGTTVVSTPIPTTTNYIVEGSGLLQIANGGTVSGLITLNNAGNLGITSGGVARNTTVNSGGIDHIFSGNWLRFFGANLPN